jgi:hypothetical protein
MLTFEINLIWLPLMILLPAIAGYLMRSSQLAKSKKRILSLENEMLNNHAEILRLQKELVSFEKEMRANKTRVVNIKEVSSEEAQRAPKQKTGKE